MLILSTTKVNTTLRPKEKSYNSRHAGYSSLLSFSENMSSKKSDFKIFQISNNSKKTANDISFGGSSFSGVEKIQKSGIWKLFNQTWFKNFISKADSSQTIFDAIFALGITCALRPAAIMLQSNEKTKEKNKKAASHSIASGVIGYGFAVAIFSPIKKGLDKIKKHPEFYAKKAAKFFKYADKGMNKSMSSSKRVQTFTMLVNKLTEVLTASVRSSITIAMIPFIDKYVLNKVFGTTKLSEKKEIKNPIYKYNYINFKNSGNAEKTFHSFAGAIK